MKLLMEQWRQYLTEGQSTLGDQLFVHPHVEYMFDMRYDDDLAFKDEYDISTYQSVWEKECQEDLADLDVLTRVRMCDDKVKRKARKWNAENEKKEKSGQFKKKELDITPHPVENRPDKIKLKDKPTGGIWTSSAHKIQRTEVDDTTGYQRTLDLYTSPWNDFLPGSGLGAKQSHMGALVIPNPDANVYTIKTEEDLKSLQTQFPLTEGGVDWEKAFTVYDGIQYTGEDASADPGDWMVESTLWKDASFFTLKDVVDIPADQKQVGF